MADDGVDVEIERAINETFECGVGGHEEGAEDEEQRHGDRESAEDRERVLTHFVPGHLLPVDIGAEKHERSDG